MNPGPLQRGQSLCTWTLPTELKSALKLGILKGICNWLPCEVAITMCAQLLSQIQSGQRRITASKATSGFEEICISGIEFRAIEVSSQNITSVCCMIDSIESVALQFLQLLLEDDDSVFPVLNSLK